MFEILRLRDKRNRARLRYLELDVVLSNLIGKLRHSFPTMTEERVQRICEMIKR